MSVNINKVLQIVGEQTITITVQQEQLQAQSNLIKQLQAKAQELEAPAQCPDTIPES